MNQKYTNEAVVTNSLPKQLYFLLLSELTTSFDIFSTEQKFSIYTKKFSKFAEVHSPNVLKTMVEIVISGRLGGSVFNFFSTAPNHGGQPCPPC